MRKYIHCAAGGYPVVDPPGGPGGIPNPTPPPGPVGGAPGTHGDPYIFMIEP